MKNIRLLLLIPVLSVLIFSCQKEVDLQDDLPNTGGSGGTGGNAQSIVGDYDFVGIGGDTRSETTVVDPTLGTAVGVATSSYQSTNNSGTVKLTSNQFSYTNLSYAVNTTAHTQLYLDGALLLEQDAPYVVPPTPISGSENYTRNNNDSLTFNNTIFIAQNPFSANVTPTPMGARISWSGDTLVLRFNHKLSGTVTNQLGQPGTFVGTFKGTLKLKKK